MVVTNQMTTRFTASGTGYLTPALGTSWGHAPSCRLLLDWDPTHKFRWLTVIKSASLAPASAAYQVTRDGLRDVIVADGAGTLVPPRIVVQDGAAGTSFVQSSASHTQ